MKEKILKDFLKYIAIDTQSNPTSNAKPSSLKQFDLLKILNKDLIELGISTKFDETNGYVYGLLKGEKNILKLGLVAHVDTSPDYSGKNVKPQILKNYNGDNIPLDDKSELSPKEFPELKNYIGQTLITTSGNTLLGADDKSGISEIINALSYIIDNKIKHGDIYIAFTTDEEVGRGIENFDFTFFNPDFAYTVDGGKLGELQFENFNAASCDITISGKNIHPGEAKGKMINSMELANQFHSKLPAMEKPEYTTEYEGFFLLTSLNGTVENTTLSYIIRDHDKELFHQRKEIINNIFKEVIKPVSPTSNIIIKDQYYNMEEKLKDKMFIIDIAKKSMEDLNIIPIIEPIRGGTDGANLSFKGIPCPNLFTGGHNFHGKYEFISLDSMEKATLTIIQIIKNTFQYK